MCTHCTVYTHAPLHLISIIASILEVAVLFFITQRFCSKTTHTHTHQNHYTQNICMCTEFIEPSVTYKIIHQLHTLLCVKFHDDQSIFLSRAPSSWLSKFIANIKLLFTEQKHYVHACISAWQKSTTRTGACV